MRSFICTTQNFLPPDTHVCMSGGTINVDFLKKKIASILNGWSQCKHLHVFAIYLVNKYMFKVNNRDAILVLLLLLVGDIHPFTLLLTNWLLHCIKYEFHLISWGGNFVETNSFCRVLPRVALNLHLSDA